MGFPIATVDRKTIRQRIGYNLPGPPIIVSTASANGSTTTLVDTVGLAKGDDTNYVGHHLIFISGTAGNIGAKRWVSAFNSTSKTLTIAAVTSTVAADGYELWAAPYNIDQINALISQAENLAYPVCLVEKSDTSTFTSTGRHRYSIPSGFVALSSIEYVYSTDNEVTIDSCSVVWSELVDGDVTASIDNTIDVGGTPSLKLVVAAGCAAGDILATQAISSLDLSGYSEVEISIYSTVALDAGDIQLLLDNTASCASAVETLNIPATDANKSTRHLISLANPASDTAIISEGLKMAVDKGAFTLYARLIKAVDADSREYKPLNPHEWKIVRGSTNYLDLTDTGLSITGTETLLRINGYQALTAMSADSSNSEVEPSAIVDWVTGVLQGENRRELDAAFKSRVSTSVMIGTRLI